MIRMQKVGKFAGKALKTLMFPLAVYIIFFILSKFLTNSRFGNWDSINIILQQAVLNAMIGWSMSFNMVNGRWDFSIGSMVMIVGIIGGNMALDLDMGAHGILLFCLIYFFGNTIPPKKPLAQAQQQGSAIDINTVLAASKAQLSEMFSPHSLQKGCV